MEKFFFKKCLGQNFLRNKHIICKIVDAIDPSCKAITEICIGQGALTKEILSRGIRVKGLEIDERCIAIVEALNFLNLEILHADVLKHNFAFEPVIGNLPYNIGTKIIEKFFHQKIPFGIFMLQKEVAMRMIEISRLSISVKAFYDVQKIIDVPSSAFVPAPSVNSMVVKIVLHNKYPALDFEKLSNMTRVFFQHRRKQLSYFKKKHPEISEPLEKFKIDLTLRPENLSFEQYYNMCQRDA